MDIIQMTRELGAAIQQDERYLRFAKARETNDQLSAGSRQGKSGHAENGEL